jgi:prepilin-type processing-associated H-X9-DG protein
MRQQGVAWNMYLNDNNGNFVSHWPHVGPPYPHIFWFTLLDSYINNERLWKCPSHSDPSWSESYSHLSYGYNNNAFTAPNLPANANVAKLREPTRDILIGDSVRGTDNWSCIIDSPLHTTRAAYGGLSDRHLNGINLLWVDGHVDWHSYKTVLNENSGAYNSPPPGWYGPQPWFRDPAYSYY